VHFARRRVDVDGVIAITPVRRERVHRPAAASTRTRRPK
jgi:hypothetical protein